MIVDDCDDLVPLNFGADPYVFIGIGKYALPVSSVGNSVVNDQSQDSLKGMVPPLHLEVRTNALGLRSVGLSAPLLYPRSEAVAVGAVVGEEFVGGHISGVVLGYQVEPLVDLVGEELGVGFDEVERLHPDCLAFVGGIVAARPERESVVVNEGVDLFFDVLAELLGVLPGLIDIA